MPEIDRELYVKRYPELARLSEEFDRNTIARNLVVRCNGFLRRSSDRNVLIDNLTTAEDPGFRNVAEADFQLLETSAACSQIGFRPIPVGEIGLYVDPYRTELPSDR